MPPLFSVVIPVRNDARWLSGAIASVLSQTCADWELVIGDNASSDNSRLVADTGDPRVLYRRFDEAVDVIASVNRTASLANGRWIVPIGADDRLMPEALETFAAAITERPGPVMVVAACSRIDQDGQPAAATWRFYQGLAEIEPGDHDTRSWIRAVTASGQPPWNIGSIAFNGSIVKSLGGFLDPSAGPASDIELVLRMAIGGTVRYVDKRVLVYTQRTDSDHRLQQRQNRIADDEDTVLSRALRASLSNFERWRRPLDAQERGWIEDAIARSFLQRAGHHRLLPGGMGRRGAWHDVRRAWNTSHAAVLAPRELLISLGTLVAPTWTLEAANHVLREARS